MNTTEGNEKITGSIENVVYRNESNDYTVLEVLTPKSELITAVGMMPMAFEGENVVLYGNWTFHKAFGKQFSFEFYEKNPHFLEPVFQRANGHKRGYAFLQGPSRRKRGCLKGI